MASVLATPVNFRNVQGLLGASAERRKRYLVVVAAAHVRKLLPPADCTRDLLATLTRKIECSVTRCPGARGVNAKFIQRDPVCDKIYRRLRNLPAKAPWPRSPDGTLMSRAQLEESVASDRWWIDAIQARRQAYADESESDLEAFRDLLIQPMPLEERVRRYAPPVAPPSRIVVDRTLKRLPDGELALLYRDGCRSLARLRAALRRDVIERARKLAAIHRRRLGIV
jgi:hypothetical protein